MKYLEIIIEAGTPYTKSTYKGKGAQALEGANVFSEKKIFIIAS